ncbi:MAG: choice-of-anchor Q domain-containing protein [Bacteroidota bacterium]
MGGAIYCTLYSSLTIRNSIIWGNTASVSGNQIYLSDENSDPDFYFCNIQGGKTAIGLNSSGIFYTGIYQNNIDTLPLFVSPSLGTGTDYNGATSNWSLQSLSPCINSGSPDTTGFNLSTTDIIGNPRIINNRIDLGAYEYSSNNSIFEAKSSKINVNPNPFSNSIAIETLKQSEIELLNINGQIIKTTDSSNLTTIMELGYLPTWSLYYESKNRYRNYFY